MLKNVKNTLFYHPLKGNFYPDLITKHERNNTINKVFWRNFLHPRLS